MVREKKIRSFSRQFNKKVVLPTLKNIRYLFAKFKIDGKIPAAAQIFKFFLNLPKCQVGKFTNLLKLKWVLVDFV